jgi:hypothetical protein
MTRSSDFINGLKTFILESEILIAMLSHPLRPNLKSTCCFFMKS